MSARIKWGVLGSGGIARRRTIPEGIVASDHAELRMVYDVNAKLNSEVARQFGAVAVASLDDLCCSDVEAVYIASPAHCHLAQVLTAAEAGKHVLCEKPLGMTVAEAEQMIAACRREGVRLGVGLMMRFHACHREALRMVEAGRLGKLVLGRAQLSCWHPPMPGAWRQDPALGGGGSLIDMGGHTIDLLEMFFGPVKEVFCRTGHLVHSYASEDSAAVLLTFESGAVGHDRRVLLRARRRQHKPTGALRYPGQHSGRGHDRPVAGRNYGRPSGGGQHAVRYPTSPQRCRSTGHCAIAGQHVPGGDRRLLPSHPRRTRSRL
jgi:predicted dehydrogenase